MSNQTPQELLTEFYKQYNLGAEGGNYCASVKIEFTKYFYLYFPNFAARKEVVLKHDIHHIVTEYPSTFKGETEIGAWEIGSGCKNYWVAWTLDTSAVMAGILFNFWGVIKAYARGRRTKNLYSNDISDTVVMSMKLSDIEKHLLLDKYSKNTMPNTADFFSFAAFGIVGTVYSILTLVIFPFVIIYTIYIKSQRLLQHQKS
jgi:hypothetical protein